ncbi:MAG: hypothetical protein HC830_12930 [Bacteroidetes bacterium]|nr:hypothetical protein [Bacteroidota bacterium]
MRFLRDHPHQTAAINFIDETTQDVVPATIEYSTSSNFSSAVSGNGNKIDVVPGTDLYFRYKATSDQFRSTSFPLDVPSRTVPTYGVDFINSLTNKTVPATDEYSVNANMSGATSGNNTKLTLTPGVDLYFRTKATASVFLSNIQHLDIPAKTTPNYSVDFATKQTNVVVPATDEYSVNANMSGASLGNNTKLTLTPGTDLYFRTKASSSGFQSNIQHLVVPAIPAVPNYVVDFVNKTTTANVPATVEYSTNSNMSGATAGTNTKVSLTPGTDLYLRTKSTATAFASAIQTLDVPAAPAQPAYVVDFSTEKQLQMFRQQ